MSEIVSTIFGKIGIINDTNKHASKIKDKKRTIFIEYRHGLFEKFDPRVLETKEIDR